MSDDRSSPAGASAPTGTGRLSALDLVTIALLPALTVYLGLNAGGYFAGETGWATVVVILVLAARVAFWRGRPRWPGRPLTLGIAGLALFAIWTLLTGAWSGDWGAALIEFDRALLYVLVLLAFGALEQPRVALRYLPHAFALAAVFLCAAAFWSRTVPDLGPFTFTAESGKLAYPLTYSNGVGILAALAMLNCLHLASWEREPALVRVAAIAALPMLAATLMLTRSEGAVAAGILGVVFYVVLGRPRGLPAALLVAIPVAALAAFAATDAALLGSGDPTAPAQLDEGHRLARTIGLLTLAAVAALALLIQIERRLRRTALARRGAGGPAAALIVFLVIGAGSAVAVADGDGVDGWHARVAWEERVDYWGVALDAFAEAPVGGEGAATFEERWARDRPEGLGLPGSTEAHSLYLETLGELGLVGLALLLTVLGAIAAASVGIAGGALRPLGAIVLAAVATWLLHAAVDWDWELPAATLWLFAFGGSVLAAWRPGARARAPSPPWRAVATVLCLALAATPVTIAVSQERLDRAVAAFLRDDCEEAEREAASATDVLSVRAEPYEVLAYCASRRGEDDRAVRMMTEALNHDPSNWEYQYGLALVRAAGGENPKAPALEALRLNPLESMVREAVRALAGVDLVEDALRDFWEDDPARWQRVARRSPLPLP